MATSDLWGGATDGTYSSPALEVDISNTQKYLLIKAGGAPANVVLLVEQL